jgi:hypothetical protein
VQHALDRPEITTKIRVKNLTEIDYSDKLAVDATTMMMIMMVIFMMMIMMIIIIIIIIIIRSLKKFGLLVWI